MAFDRELIQNISRLARIGMSDEKLANLAPELTTIIDWVEQLSEVNTDEVEPMNNVTKIPLPQRIDKVSDGGCSEDIIKNAPDRIDDYFAVPKVVE